MLCFLKNIEPKKKNNFKKDHKCIIFIQQQFLTKKAPWFQLTLQNRAASALSHPETSLAQAFSASTLGIRRGGGGNPKVLGLAVMYIDHARSPLARTQPHGPTTLKWLEMEPLSGHLFPGQRHTTEERVHISDEHSSTLASL